MTYSFEGTSPCRTTTLTITTTAWVLLSPKCQDPWALYLLWPTTLAGLVAIYLAGRQSCRDGFARPI